jgi:diguanylate cyclase (GGDEF)-like protein/PAS domain S-box-containing protein
MDNRTNHRRCVVRDGVGLRAVGWSCGLFFEYLKFASMRFSDLIQGRPSGHCLGASGRLRGIRFPRREERARGLSTVCLLLIVSLICPQAWSEARVVKVGVYQNPPKIFLADDQVSGIFGDLLRRIAYEEDWKLEPVVCEWQSCLRLLRAGKIDLMPDVALTQRRTATMSFGTVPALYSWSEIYRNKQVALTSVRDLPGKRVAVLAGSVQETYLANMMHSFGLRNVRLVPVESLAKGFRMAASGRVAAVAANNFFGGMAAARYDLANTPILFQPTQLFFVTTKGRNGALLKAIDRHLKQWEARPGSPYYQVLARWKVSPERTIVPIWLWWGLGAMAGLLLLALAAVLMQRREVAEKTRSLQISESKLALILDNIDSYIYIKDLDLKYQYVNRKVAELFGRLPEDIQGQSDEAFFDPESARRIRDYDQRVLQQAHSLTLEEENRSRDGNLLRSYLTVKQPLYDENGQVYALCGISTDFTEQKQSQEKIHQLAFYDPLTHLPNRSLVLERAEHALAGYARSRLDGAVLFIDLDNFKVLNDTLGHAQGDVLLQQVAARLSRELRDNDTLARWGGDEFVLLMENLGREREVCNRNIEVVARKLLRSFSQPFELDAHIYNITASIGAAMFSDAIDSIDDLLKRADMAMYEAKSRGRNLLKFFNPAMQASLEARAELETELHDALQRQQFVLYYQPQVDAVGDVVGAEALIRWKHPVKGVISPAVFIHVAELTGQILPLGRWILRTACMQLAEWASDPDREHLVVAVNVSAREFHQADFVAGVQKILQETGANPERLELELTESLLADDVEAMIGKMEALKRYGIRFSLDDFGTGYSSLSYLKRLPLDQLKIDCSFVRDLLTDADDEAIVRTILTLGESMDILIVAEGVETPEQRDALLRLGCHRQQGYLFGRPAPAGELPLEISDDAVSEVR